MDEVLSRGRKETNLLLVVRDYASDEVRRGRSQVLHQAVELLLIQLVGSSEHPSFRAQHV